MRMALVSIFVLSIAGPWLVPDVATAQGSGRFSIRGAVVTSSGQAVGSVWVTLERNGREAGRALTADDGRYYVARLRRGSYTLLVRRGRTIVHREPVALPRDAVRDVVLRDP